MLRKLNVEVKDVFYRESDSYIVKGSFGCKERGDYIGQAMVIAGNCGTYRVVEKAHMILVILLEKHHEVWIEWALKKHLKIKRLTKKVQRRIVETIPNNVIVEEKVSRVGNLYYALSEESAIAWARSIIS